MTITPSLIRAEKMSENELREEIRKTASELYIFDGKSPREIIHLEDKLAMLRGILSNKFGAN